MKLTRASVIVQSLGVDQVYLFTDLPAPFTYGDPGAGLVLKFEATKGHGVDYVRRHFSDLPLEVVDGSTGNTVRTTRLEPKA